MFPRGNVGRKMVNLASFAKPVSSVPQWCFLPMTDEAKGTLGETPHVSDLFEDW